MTVTDRLLGFQVVLLDEQGQEICRIPDVYYDHKSILVEDVHYREQQVKMEGGQRVRYFKRLNQRAVGH